MAIKELRCGNSAPPDLFGAARATGCSTKAGFEADDMESKLICEAVLPIFDEFVKKYDEKKYSPEIYECAKKEFSARKPQNTQIESAIKWKYGKTNSSGMTRSHEAIITEVHGLWSKYIEESGGFTAEQTFNWWSAAFKRKTMYITTAYITHLVHGAEGIPIIDQHNYRAMASLIKRVKPSFKVKSVPSSWSDIATLKNFMHSIQDCLAGRTLGDIDRFLMMHGKSIKKRRTKNS